MIVRINRHECIVERTDEHREKFKRSGYSGCADSGVFYAVQRILNARGYDLAKGTPGDHGHLTGEPYYLYPRKRGKGPHIYIHDGGYALRCAAEDFNKFGTVTLNVEYDVNGEQPDCLDHVKALEESVQVRWDHNSQTHSAMLESLRRYECFCVRSDGKRWDLEDMANPNSWVGHGATTYYKAAVEAGVMRRATGNGGYDVGPEKGASGWWAFTEEGARIALAWHWAGYKCGEHDSYQLYDTPSHKGVGYLPVDVIGKAGWQMERQAVTA